MAVNYILPANTVHEYYTETDMTWDTPWVIAGGSDLIQFIINYVKRF